MAETVLYFKDSEVSGKPEDIVSEIWSSCFSALQKCFGVLIEYEDSSGDLSERIVYPEVIFEDSGIWYMAAFCTLREKERCFRFNRIRRAELTDEKFTSCGIAGAYQEQGIPWRRFSQTGDPKIIRQEQESVNPAHKALRYAIQANDLQRAASALEQGAYLDAPFADGKIPLSEAASYGSLEMVKFLLEKGADCRLRDNNGNIPFNLAIRTGKFDMAEMLFEMFPEGIEYADYLLETTPLEDAVRCGWVESALFLIDRGADVNYRRKNDNATLLMLAAGTDSDVNGAIIVRKLLEKGLKTESVDKNSKTALFYAVENGNVRCIEILIAAGADVNAQESEMEKTPLLWLFDQFDSPGKNAWRRDGEELLEIVKLLCEAGADVDCSDSAGVTPLMLAGGEVMAYLLAAGASPRSETYDNSTVAMYHADSLRDLMILEHHGADMYACNSSDENILSWTKPDYRHISFLIRRYGFSVNTCNKYGHSILRAAIEAGDVEAVAFLLDRGAKVSENYLGSSYPSIREKSGAHRKIDEMICAKRKQLTQLLLRSCRELDLPGIRMYAEQGAYILSSLPPLADAFMKKRDFPLGIFVELCDFLIDSGANITETASDGSSFIAVLLLRNKKQWAKRYLKRFVDECYREEYSPRFPESYPRELRELQFIYRLEHNNEKAPLLDLVMDFLKEINFKGAEII